MTKYSHYAIIGFIVAITAFHITTSLMQYLTGISLGVLPTSAPTPTTPNPLLFV
jgi:hypothetical protein